MLPPHAPNEAVLIATHEQRHRDRYLTTNRRDQVRPRRIPRIRLNLTTLSRIFRLPRPTAPDSAR